MFFPIFIFSRRKLSSLDSSSDSASSVEATPTSRTFEPGQLEALPSFDTHLNPQAVQITGEGRWHRHAFLSVGYTLKSEIISSSLLYNQL